MSNLNSIGQTRVNVSFQITGTVGELSLFHDEWQKNSNRRLDDHSHRESSARIVIYYPITGLDSYCALSRPIPYRYDANVTVVRGNGYATIRIWSIGNPIIQLP